MIIRHDFPDLLWLKKQIETRFQLATPTAPRAGTQGWPTVLLHVKSKADFRGGIKGPFSLFYNLSGESSVSIEQKRVSLRPGFFFLSNAAQTYDLEIPTAAETFNIHFGEQFLEEINSSVQFPEQLDRDWRTKENPFYVYNRVYPQNRRLQSLIQSIHRYKQSDCLDPLWMEEQLYYILCTILSISQADFLRMQHLPALKSSSREEIFRRLSLAVDFIYAHFDQPLSLEELARCACFSKFHFLRLFKAAFGNSPYQFITAVRIQKAKEWLCHTNWPIHLIASQIGLENTSSFSRLFRQKTGYYPTPFRDQIRK